MLNGFIAGYIETEYGCDIAHMDAKAWDEGELISEATKKKKDDGKDDDEEEEEDEDDEEEGEEDEEEDDEGEDHIILGGGFKALVESLRGGLKGT